jgi:para-nitrobenzyl esterase
MRILTKSGGGAVLLCAMLATGVAPVLAHDNDHDHGNDGPVVNTAEGPVRGFKKDGVYTFLGIPYAAPPVGNLRWRPPAPVKKWRDALDATKMGSSCPQVTTLGPFAGPTSVTEDCLFLNVYTTGKDGPKKPVVVWIHGGGNIDGEAAAYDGAKLATGGPSGAETVTVILNYRLGLFGFLSHPALNAEGHLWGNYGILDIQAVLKWVQRNAANFGGDPNRVLLGGQSAGASDTGANVISPLAAGLFNRALFQSSPTSSYPTAATALTRGTTFAYNTTTPQQSANCPGSGSSAATCLRNLSPERILQLQGTPNSNGAYITGPFVDGTIIPITPEQAWTTGNYNKMPTMGGATRDEGNFGISITEYFSGPPQVPMTLQQYNDRINAQYGANAAAVLAQYPPGSDPQFTFNRVATDPGKCRGLHVLGLWSTKIPTYAYDFTYRDAPYYFPWMPGFKALAYHTVDIQFIFPKWRGGHLGVNLDQNSGQPRELQGAERTLSDRLVAAWTKFAATGNPNGGTSNSPWPKYNSPSASILNQNLSFTTDSTATYRSSYKCDFWDPLQTY